VLGNDSDVDGDGLTAVLDQDVSHGGLTLNPDGSFSYTPEPGYTGPDSFQYHASGGSAASNTVTVSFLVVLSL
jgi:VCBS repeat-containing protein